MYRIVSTSPRPSPVSAPGPAPACCTRGTAAAAGRLRAERKPRAQTGRGGWCERLGRVPARRRLEHNVGGRAGEPGARASLTQQLGKWVCSLTRSAALAACGRRRLNSIGSLEREEQENTACSKLLPLPIARGPPRGRFWRMTLIFSPRIQRFAAPAGPEWALPTQEGIHLTSPAVVARQTS